MRPRRTESDTSSRTGDSRRYAKDTPRTRTATSSLTRPASSLRPPEDNREYRRSEQCGQDADRNFLRGDGPCDRIDTEQVTGADRGRRRQQVLMVRADEPPCEMRH